MCNFKNIINYVKQTCWIDDTDEAIIISQAQKVFEELIPGKTKSKLLYRICGQSGSGKTTQLLASLEKITFEEKLNPVVLGVRSCAKAHPLYNKFQENFPAGELREKTNGFALKCMSYVLKLLIENGYMILLDITLLDPIFEEFVLSLLKKHNYKIQYHILAVNKYISSNFINKRLKESGRIIYQSSADYFYEILPVGLNYICKNDNENQSFVWNAFDLEPVYHGKVANCFRVFKKAQNEIKRFKYSEKELLNSKCKIIKKHQI